MKLALFTVAVLTACATELVLGVIKDEDAMKVPSTAPETLRVALASVLEPVLTLLYVAALPLAFIALLCTLCVFAPAQALALVLMVLIAAAGWLLRR